MLRAVQKKEKMIDKSSKRHSKHINELTCKGKGLHWSVVRYTEVHGEQTRGIRRTKREEE